MSEDFVRRLPNSGFAFNFSSAGRNAFHLDIKMLLLLVLIVGYGLLVLFSAVEQNSGPVISQLTKISVAFAVMTVMAQISPLSLIHI